MNQEFERAAIIGVGLIGGSLGLALKGRFPGTHILGIGRHKARLDLARRMGAIDSCSTRLEGALGGCDLVILATPVDHILATLGRIGSCVSEGTLITDVGSTKRAICEKARDSLPASVEFIGGHPVAGREVTGVEHSLGNLFADAPYILCPREGFESPGLPRLLRLAEGIGARPCVMTPEEHDLAIAWVSHLPQLISTALANAVRDHDTGISGSGLRDMLRLAGSSHTVWHSILATNRDMVDRALSGFIQELGTLRKKLAEGSLADEFDTAARFYDKLKSR